MVRLFVSMCLRDLLVTKQTQAQDKALAITQV